MNTTWTELVAEVSVSRSREPTRRWNHCRVDSVGDDPKDTRENGEEGGVGSPAFECEQDERRDEKDGVLGSVPEPRACTHDNSIEERGDVSDDRGAIIATPVAVRAVAAAATSIAAAATSIAAGLTPLAALERGPDDAWYSCCHFAVGGSYLS